MSRAAFCSLLSLWGCLISVSALSLFGQGYPDLLLSTDPVRLYLPSDILIQDAVRADSVILAVWGSTEPLSAVFRNDTLFAVWEDYRNILPDIYGTWLCPADYVSGVRDGEGLRAESKGANISSIVPNPATDLVRMGYTLAESAPVRLSLVDELGRTLLQTPVENREEGSYVHDIDVSAYPAGAYRVVLHAGRQSVSTGLLILRERR